MAKQSIKVAVLALLVSFAFAPYVFADVVSGSLGVSSLSTGINVNTPNCDPLSVSNGTVAAYPDCTVTCNSGYSLSGSSCVATTASVCSVSSVSNGTVSAYPACAISCNSGYSLSGTSCVAPAASGGGGGGGGGGYYNPYTANATTTGTGSAVGTSESGSQLLISLIAQLKVLLQEAQAQGMTLTPAETAYLNAGAASPTMLSAITHDLTIGSTGADVSTLQTFLISQDKGSAASALSAASATGYFGSLTRAALAEYQKAVGIKPASGYFGSLTRAYLKSAGL